jgi:hypothetical protein
MGEPIKIVVTAETQQAAAALEAFVKNSGSGLASMAAGGAHAGEELQKLREASLLTRESFHGLESAALLMGGTRFPELAQGILGARMAMGVAREGAMLFKTSLLEIAPWITLIAASVAGGVVLWESYGGGMESAENKAKRLGDELKKIPDLLKDIEAAQKGGKITGEQADLYRSILSGNTPFYRKTGSFDPTTTEIDPKTGKEKTVGSYDYTLEARSQITSGRLRGQWRDNIPGNLADPEDLKGAQTIAQKNLPDDNSKDRIRAANEDADILRRTHEESLQGITKERQALDDKHADDRQKITDNGVLEKETYEQVTAKLTQLDASYAAQKKNIDDKEAAEKGRQLDEWMRKQSEIFNAEKKAAEEATAAENKQTEELNKQLQLRQEIDRAKNAAALTKVQGDPLLTNSEKADQSVPLIQKQLKDNALAMADNQDQQNKPQPTEAKLLLQKQYVDLQVKSAELANKLTEAEGEHNFGFQFGQALIQLQNMNNVAKELAAGFCKDNCVNGFFVLVFCFVFPCIGHEIK